MTRPNVLHVVANLVKRIQQCNALEYDPLSDKLRPSITEEDVVMYEEKVVSGRFDKVKQCALDSLVLIQGAVLPTPKVWNINIPAADFNASRALYPIVKCAIDCIINQLDEVLANASQFKEMTVDTSTLTFEGLFLIAKTGLEMLNPSVLTVENDLLYMMLQLFNKATTLKPLLNMCLTCLTVYLSRLVSADILQELESETLKTLAQIKVVFESTLNIAISGEGKELNTNAVSLLRITIRTVIHKLQQLSTSADADRNSSDVKFLTKVVDCWYSVLITTLMKLRAEMVVSSTKHVKLEKLMRLLASFPPLPPAHRLRVMLQIALTLQQDSYCLLQTETLTTLTAMMDIEDQKNSVIIRNNILPLAEAIIELLFDPRFCGNSQGATVLTDCSKQVQLVYCIAQCIRTVKTTPVDKDPQHVDEYLQQQTLSLLNSANEDQTGESERIRRLMKDTENEPELKCEYQTLEDFLASRDDCQLLTRLAKMFQYLMSYSNKALDEAIALVICWLFSEFDFGLCLKMLAPLCMHYLRTKRSKMLEGIHNSTAVPQGIASIAETVTSRWVFGGRIFYNALEAFRDTLSMRDVEIDPNTDKPQEVAIFASIFECTLDIAKESAGNFPRDLENCIGLYVKIFGLETYLRILPLEPLYSVPITSETYRTDAYVYMLPILQKQLKGVPLVVYVKYILPVLKRLEALMAKTKECVANISNETTLAFVLHSYEGLVGYFYGILTAMAACAEDCNAAIEMDDFALLKHILMILDEGTNRTVIACRIIAAFHNLDNVGTRLIGLLVKRFVAVETATPPNDSSNTQALEDALLAAIANCGKFCDSKMLGDNLQSFEAALQRTNCSYDPLVKIARALLPSVDATLKSKLHKRWVELAKTNPTRNLYLALKRSCETLALDIKKWSEDNKESGSSGDGPKIGISKYIADACSANGIIDLSDALQVLPNAKPKEETEEHSKHRMACIEAFARLLEVMKIHGFFTANLKMVIDSIVKPLILEAMLNACAPNSNTRSSALGIYDTICNLKLDEIGDVLKFSVSALASGTTITMQAVLVKCLTRLMARHSSEAVKYNLTQVFSYVFRLLSMADQKLYIQLLKFARVCIVKLNQEQVLWLAPMLMKMFDNATCCQRSKVYVRRVVQKLMVKLSRDQIIHIFPQEHLPLMHHLLAEQRHKKNHKLRRKFKSRDEDADDDEEFIGNMFKTDDEGRLIITDDVDEPEHYGDIDDHIKFVKHKKKVRQQINKKEKRGDVQPYAYIKLNRSKTAEKHKRDNIKALKSIAKPRN
ncbi:NUC173 domain family protein [Babesia bovis T2Bo]|uniref:RRP12 HEAT domain-containing protein n=1 Tax=Babesia bovis TaxID=5865 RepID=A7AVM8_BABBO|nr:NUC173 domain family protein [Babesia bovis T2Bo]EDO05854.1 NUC173 domain family protein [Babesia bovis T2Bo]|eukprot:XP_001609422.1 hypothetical protein [Babesia bovis T2Bo]